MLFKKCVNWNAIKFNYANFLSNGLMKQMATGE